MLSRKAVVHWARRIHSALNREETEIIAVNLAVVVGFYIFAYIVALETRLTAWFGTDFTWWVLAFVRVFVLLFGINVIGSVYRIVRRAVEMVEAEPLKASVASKTRDVTKRYLVRDEVPSRTEIPMVSASMPISSLPPSKSVIGIRSLSRADVVAPMAHTKGRETPTRPGTPGRVLASTPVGSTSTKAAARMSVVPALAYDDLSRRLPTWTDKLVARLQEPVDIKPVTGESKIGEVPPKDNPNQELPKAIASVERKHFSPEDSLDDLGLGIHIDTMTENLRAWFSRKILRPLADDIAEVTQEFGKRGLDHLTPNHPATFSTFGSTITTQVKSVISISPMNVAQPQNLMDLAQRMKDDPVVQKRLKLEKYLAFANLATRRSYVIGRIEAMAKGPLLAAFNSCSSSVDNDTEILLSLFCTFLDETLPSSDFYDAQPFSGKHFVRMGEEPSKRPDAIQLRQAGPQLFELVANDKIYCSYPGPNNLFHAIVFLAEYIHCHREGFLGIGNIGSRAIDLASILNN